MNSPPDFISTEGTSIYIFLNIYICRLRSSPQVGNVAHRGKSSLSHCLFLSSPLFVLKASQDVKLAIRNRAAVLLALHAILFSQCYLLMLIGQVLKNKPRN